MNAQAALELVDLAARIADRLRQETTTPRPVLTSIGSVIVDPEPTDPTDPIDQRALLIAFDCLTTGRPSREGRPRADKPVRDDFNAFGAKYGWAMPAGALEAGKRRAMKAAMFQAQRATRTKIASLLGYTYWELRGRAPSARRGQQTPFLRLVVDVFALAGIGGANNAAEHACQAKKWSEINTYKPDRQ